MTRKRNGMKKHDKKKIALIKAKTAEKMECELKRAKLAYRKMFFLNYLLIPCLLILIVLICPNKDNFPPSLMLIALSLVVYAILLVAHHQERIVKRDELPTRRDYEEAAGLMKFCSFIALAYAGLATVCIEILFRI